MNKLERLVRELKEQHPEVKVSLDPPSGGGTTWWMNAALGGREVVVEWRPHAGFGLSSTPSDGYGEGPDEVYDSSDDALDRLLVLLHEGAQTQRPAQVALRRLRESRGVSQVELAELIGTQQAAISKLERRADVSVSTLRRLVNALGGELELNARFPDHTVSIDIGSATEAQAALPLKK